MPIRKDGGGFGSGREGLKQGGDWFNSSQPYIARLSGSKSKARKAASAHIAKIPFPLAYHIGLAWLPVKEPASTNAVDPVAGIVSASPRAAKSFLPERL
jgi:hypothetical protein